MTNNEKFKEIFGFEIKTKRFSICLMQDDCDTCPFKKIEARNCIEFSRNFWDQEYEEAAGDKRGNENP